MKITFLGSGSSQGVPVIACKCPVCLSDDSKDKRLRASLLIETAGASIIIDAGPDFRQQMLREGVSDLNGILITHEHKDHIGGMDDVRAFNYISKMPIDIYSDNRVQKAIMREYPYVFTEKKYPGAPLMNLISINEEAFNIADVLIIPISVYHHRLPVTGYRIGDFAYITDANYISEESKRKLGGLEYFVINALRNEKHLSHYSLTEALKLIEELSPRKAIITHISHQMGLYNDVSKQLPANVLLAYDGLSIMTDD